MSLWPGLGGPEENPTTGLGSAGEAELQKPDAPVALAGELRVAEARVNEVESDIGSVAGVHAWGEFAAVKDLEEFGDGVSRETVML